MNNEENNKIKIEETLPMITCNIIGKNRTNYGPHHMLSASFFARLSFKIEKKYTQPLSELLQVKHRAYTVGAIMAAVASLDATINEFLMDAEDGLLPSKLFDVDSTKMLSLYYNEIRGKSEYLLSKFKKASRIINNTKLGDKNMRRNLCYLIKIRNRLIHYEPEWDNNQEVHKEIENEFKNKFGLNPFAAEDSVFFPWKCLGHGCAEWAVILSIKTIDTFYSNIKLPSILNIRRNRLATR